MSIELNDTDAQILYRALMRLDREFGTLESGEEIAKAHLYNYLHNVLNIYEPDM